MDGDQRLAMDEAGAGVHSRAAHASRRCAARASWTFSSKPRPLREGVEIGGVAAGPGEERNLVDRAPEGHGVGGVAGTRGGGAGEGGEAVDEGGGPDVEVVGPAVVEEVPDHLGARLRGCGEHRRPAREVDTAPGRGSIRCQRRPSRIVRMPSDRELAIVGRGVGVVAGAGDHVEPAARAQPVRRAFPAALQEAPEEPRWRRRGRLAPARRRTAPAIAAPPPRPRKCRTTWRAQRLRRGDGAGRGARTRRRMRGGGCGGVFVRHEEAADPVVDLLQRAVVGRGDHRPRPARPASAMTCGMPSPRDSQTKTSSAASRSGTSQRSPRKRRTPSSPSAVAPGRGAGGILRHEGVGPPIDHEPRRGLGGAGRAPRPRGSPRPASCGRAARPSRSAARPGRSRARRGPGPRPGGANSPRSTIDGISTACCSRPGMRPRRRRGCCADPDVARGEVLRAGQRLGDQPAVLDQRRAQRKPFQRRIDVGHVLAGHDDVVARQLAGEVGDGVLEREAVGVVSTWMPGVPAGDASARACPACESRGSRRSGSARGSRCRASRRTSVSSPPTTSQAKTKRMRIGCGRLAVITPPRRRSAGTRAAPRQAAQELRRLRRTAPRG